MGIKASCISASSLPSPRGRNRRRSCRYPAIQVRSPGRGARGFQNGGGGGEAGGLGGVAEVDKGKALLPGAHNAHPLPLPPSAVPNPRPPPLTSLAIRAALPLVLMRVWAIRFLPLALPAGLRGAYSPFSIPFSISISIIVCALCLHVSDAALFRPRAADVAAGVGIHVRDHRGGGAGRGGGV